MFAATGSDHGGTTWSYSHPGWDLHVADIFQLISGVRDSPGNSNLLDCPSHPVSNMARFSSLDQSGVTTLFSVLDISGWNGLPLLSKREFQEAPCVSGGVGVDIHRLIMFTQKRELNWIWSHHAHNLIGRWIDCNHIPLRYTNPSYVGRLQPGRL